MAKQAKSGIVYRGPSLLDGAPIVAIATYTASNRKTGAVLQTYIIRADMAPIVASRTGADAAICGDCPLRGIARPDADAGQAAARGCYVTLAHGPQQVFRGLASGAYADAQDSAARAELGRGRVVRLGTYGDPAAVPLAVWQDLTADAENWTGYTHQARRAPGLLDVCMASVESLPAAQAAWAAGGRTFRIVASVDDVDPAREVLCPASAEAGYRTTCAACRLCNGRTSKSPKSVAIVAHGNGARHVAA